MYLVYVLPVPENIEALLFCYCHPVQMPGFCLFLCICSIWGHWSKPPAGPGLAWSHLLPERSLFVGRQPIMEMFQQLFKLQISFSFLLPLCRACCFLFPIHSSPVLLLSFLQTLSPSSLLSPRGETNCITETFLSNALPLSLLLSYLPLKLLASLTTFLCLISIHIVELCGSRLVVPAGSGAKPESSGAAPLGNVCCRGLSLPLLFGVDEHIPAPPSIVYFLGHSVASFTLSFLLSFLGFSVSLSLSLPP